MYGFFGKNPKALIGASAAVADAYLPQVAIYSDLTPPLVSSLSDIVYSSSQAIVSSRTNPIKAKKITINAGVVLTSADYSIWLWADEIVFNGTCNVSGSAGFIGSISCTWVGGSGGPGGGGGGGGGATGSCSPADGGRGGTGGDGQQGDAGDCSSTGGDGGLGYRNTYDLGNPYTLPLGGDGGGSAAAGAGTRGAGGGGEGGPAFGGICGGSVGGGGGAGAGFIGAIARKIIGGTATLLANGGAGGDAIAGNSGYPGGGGVILLGAIQYDNGIAFQVDPAAGGCCSFAQQGNYRILELDSLGTTILATHDGSGGTWNHL